MIALVFSPIASHQEYRLADLLSMTHPKIFAQPPGETSHDYALFLVGSRSHRPRRILGAEAWRRCVWRLRTAMPPWSSSWSLRGPRWTRPATAAAAPEGFSGRLGSGSGEVMEGANTRAADCMLCFGMLRAVLAVSSCSFVLGWASWNFDQRKWVESRRNHVVSKCSLDLVF